MENIGYKKITSLFLNGNQLTELSKNMHEISLLKNIFRILEQAFPKKTERLSGISLKAGILSSIQPILMKTLLKQYCSMNPGMATTIGILY